MAENNLEFAWVYTVPRIVILSLGFLTILPLIPWIRRFVFPLSQFGDFVQLCLVVVVTLSPFLALIVVSYIVGTSAPGNVVLLLTAVLVTPPGMLVYWLESQALQPTGAMVIELVPVFQLAACVIGGVVALLVKLWSKRRRRRDV